MTYFEKLQQKEMEKLAEIILEEYTNGYSEVDKEMLAKALYNLGYCRQSKGRWEIVIGSNGKEKMVCTNCRHQQDLASTFTYCPNCGARMKGGAE